MNNDKMSVPEAHAAVKAAERATEAGTPAKDTIRRYVFSIWHEAVIESGSGNLVKYADHLAALDARAEEARREGAEAMRLALEGSEQRAKAEVRKLQEQLAQRTAGGDAVAQAIESMRVATRNAHEVLQPRFPVIGAALYMSMEELMKAVAAQPVAEAAAQADDEAHKLARILFDQCEGGGEPRNVDIYADSYQPGDGDVYAYRAAELLIEQAAEIAEFRRYVDMLASAAAPTAQPTPPDDENIEADAYNYACDLMEEGWKERAKRGVEVGTQSSLCDGIAWIFGHMKKLETAALHHPPVSSDEHVPNVGKAGLLEGWTVERRDNPPFRSIAVRSPDGKVALLSSIAQNPENVFYEFADAILSSSTNAAPNVADEDAAQPPTDWRADIDNIAEELESEAMNYEGDFADTVKGCAEALYKIAAAKGKP